MAFSVEYVTTYYLVVDLRTGYFIAVSI